MLSEGGQAEEAFPVCAILRRSADNAATVRSSSQKIPTTSTLRAFHPESKGVDPPK
jgi:hypothetical protein